MGVGPPSNGRAVPTPLGGSMGGWNTHGRALAWRWKLVGSRLEPLIAQAHWWGWRSAQDRASACCLDGGPIVPMWMRLALSNLDIAGPSATFETPSASASRAEIMGA